MFTKHQEVCESGLGPHLLANHSPPPPPGCNTHHCHAFLSCQRPALPAQWPRLSPLPCTLYTKEGTGRFPLNAREKQGPVLLNANQTDCSRCSCNSGEHGRASQTTAWSSGQPSPHAPRGQRGSSSRTATPRGEGGGQGAPRGRGTMCKPERRDPQPTEAELLIRS